MQPDRDKLRLEHILEAIEKLNKWFVNLSIDTFSRDTDEKTFDAALMKLVFVGELSAKITKKTQDKYPKVPWKQLKDLRNVIAHEYLGVDATQIFLVVTEELPRLRIQLEIVLNDLE